LAVPKLAPPASPPAVKAKAKDEPKSKLAKKVLVKYRELVGFIAQYSHIDKDNMATESATGTIAKVSRNVNHKFKVEHICLWLRIRNNNYNYMLLRFLICEEP
jgi:hypothetical protein